MIYSNSYSIASRATGARAMALCLAAIALAGCSSVKVWPFGEDSKENPRNPANSTEYQCDKNKRFFLRLPDNGASAWVILPDREFGLPKAGEGSYSNGVSTLTIAGGEATLQLGKDNVYSACKLPAKPENPK